MTELMEAEGTVAGTTRWPGVGSSSDIIQIHGHYTHTDRQTRYKSRKEIERKLQSLWA